MALILESPAYKGKLGVFWGNRLLRLFPVYAFVLVLTTLAGLAIWYVSGRPNLLFAWVRNIDQLSIGTIGYLTLSNLLIAGQSVNFFLSIRSDGALAATDGFESALVEPVQFMLVPQAWSIDLERMFFCLAPFLVRLRTWLLVFAIVLTTIARFKWYDYHSVAAAHAGAWGGRFFPFEIAIFLAGILSYRIYDYLNRHAMAIRYLRLVGVATLLLVLIWFFRFPGSTFAQGDFYGLIYFFAFFSIPVIFFATKESRVDTWIGDLSYPIYITHFFVISMLRPYMPDLVNLAVVACVLTLVASVGLKMYISDPIDKCRTARKRASRSVTKPADS